VDGETFLGNSDPTPDATRHLQIDATGLYFQHNEQSDTNSALTLSVNQVGWALVGWITRTSSYVQSQQLSTDGDVMSAVFVANLDPAGPPTPPPQVGTSSATASVLFYKDVDGISGHDPSEVLDPANPFSIETQQDIDSQTAVKTGWIAIDVIAGPSEGTWQEVVPRLRISLLLVRQNDHLNPTVVQTLVFDMHDPLPRPSERTIGAQEPTLKDYLVAQHGPQPPPSFFDPDKPSGQAWQAAVAMFAEGGELETVIRGYISVADGVASQRSAALVQIQNLLALRIGAWQGRGAHSGLLNKKLINKADRLLSIKVDNPGWFVSLLKDGALVMTCTQWLSFIGSHEMAIVQKSANDVAPGAVPSLQAAPKELLWLGSDGKIYHYDMVFSPLNPGELAELKKRIPQLPDKAIQQIPKVPDKDVKAGPLTVILGAFKVVISASSAVSLNGVPPTDDKFFPEWKDQVFFGMFGEVGTGLGGLPQLPDKLQVVSAWKLDPDAFSTAIFEIKAIKAQFTMPGFDKLTVGGATQLMTFVTKDGMVIEGVAGNTSVVPTTITGDDLIPDPKKVDKIIKKSRGKSASKSVWDTLVDGTALGVTVGTGSLMVGRPEVDHWVPPPKERTAEGGDGRTVTAFFARDSADIGGNVRGWSRRFLLESVLAADLYLFNGSPSFNVIGHASPEGTPRHNLILSRLRAAVVRQAILDTGIIDADFIGSEGLGDELATKGDGTPGEPHLAEPDPDGDTAKRDAFLQGPHKEEALLWPEFRKVVIEWLGRFFLKINTVDGSDEDAPPSQTQPSTTPSGSQTSDPNAVA